jgi:membrane protein implicated in regulation of membrane protease activity
MGILLWVLGTLALGSGAVKLRTRTRTLAGQSPLAVAEMLAGAILVAGAGLGLARARPLAWLSVLAVLGLVVVSAVSHARHLMRRAAEQERSAEQRFRRYLERP